MLLLAGGRLAADGAAGEILRDRALLEENGLELPLCLAGVRTGSERGLRPALLQFPRAYRIMLEAGRKKTENVEMTERIVFLWIVQN